MITEKMAPLQNVRVARRLEDRDLSSRIITSTGVLIDP